MKGRKKENKAGGNTDKTRERDELREGEEEEIHRK